MEAHFRPQGQFTGSICNSNSISVFLWPWRPFNLIPDQLAYLGKVDDVIVLGLSLLLLIKLSPKHIVDEHRGTGPKTNRPEDSNPSNVVDSTAKFTDDE